MRRTREEAAIAALPQGQVDEAIEGVGKVARRDEFRQVEGVALQERDLEWATEEVAGWY